MCVCKCPSSCLDNGGFTGLMEAVQILKHINGLVLETCTSLYIYSLMLWHVRCMNLITPHSIMAVKICAALEVFMMGLYIGLMLDRWSPSVGKSQLCWI
jgi:hypothetical protein